MRFAAVVLASAGCLSEPGFPAVTGEAFPPSGVDVAVRAAAVADLNRDSVPDLVVASEPAEADRGLFLLFGHPDGLRYHAFVPSPELPPNAVWAGDVDRDELIDLVVLGVVDTDDAKLAVYRGDGPGGIRYRPGLVRAIADGYLSPTSDRVYITPVQLDGDPHQDFILGQFRWEAAIELDAFDDRFVDVPVAAVPRAADDGAGTIAATPVPNPEQDGDDLLIVRYDASSYFSSPGGVQFPDSGVAMPYTTPLAVSHAGFFDLDGDGGLDILGFGAGRLNAQLPDPGSPRDVRHPEYYEGEVSWYHVSDLDGSGSAEVIIALTVDGSTSLVMFADVSVDADASELGATERPPLDLPDFVIAAAGAADFDGDGEIELQLIDAAGQRRCVIARATGLSPC